MARTTIGIHRVTSNEGGCVVRVRAQVMLRDEKSGGWLPMGGGGLSNVAVRRRRVNHEINSDDMEENNGCNDHLETKEKRLCKHEYLIHGRRISDQRVVLSCSIKRDFEYNKVMPTFHHWKTGNKKFGLTFQTAADARAFDRGVRMAMQDLLDGITESSRLQQYNLDVADDDVFVQLTLPMDKSPSPREPSTQATTTQSSCPPSSSSSSSSSMPSTNVATVPSVNVANDASTVNHACPSSLLSAMQTSLSPSTTTTGPSSSAVPWTSAAEEQQMEHEQRALLDPERQRALALDKEYSYVQCLVSSPKSSSLMSSTLTTLPTMTTAHDYAYPRLSVVSSCGVRKASSPGDSAKQLGDRVSLVVDNSNALETASNNGHVSKSVTQGSSRLALCVYCGEHFELESNKRGACQFAPDCSRGCVQRLSCLPCAECTLYHCLSDAEGEHASPCDCRDDDGLRSRRWTVLTLLAILAPCLCLYPPLTLCHKAAKACHVCGARHVAAQRE